MIDIATVSSKGQIVIPMKMREEIGLHQNDKLVLLSEKDTIVVKKLKEDELKSRMRKMLDMFSDGFKKHGISQHDIREEITALRKAL
ncbi:AbrB/MazE/SpoVT family DNA-binding domain-containing protein [Candidatus Woesearchaeota archaeon]|nr:AbrB/MazE/SpoVT family DNA-binding domain-containing protein [Candidatus Woesearchaeota archaeon]